MTPREYVERVRARIADPARWTQGTNARDATGAACFWWPPRPQTNFFGRPVPEPVQWCVEGAAFCELIEARQPLRPDYSAALNLGWARHLNDCGSHADVLAYLDAALARL